MEFGLWPLKLGEEKGPRVQSETADSIQKDIHNLSIYSNYHHNILINHNFKKFFLYNDPIIKEVFFM